jgi:hypothetical protein
MNMKRIFKIMISNIKSMISPSIIRINRISILIIYSEGATIINLRVPIGRLLNESIVDRIHLVNGNRYTDIRRSYTTQTSFEMSVHLVFNRNNMLVTLSV